MIKNLKIDTVGMPMSDELRKYVGRKLGRLDLSVYKILRADIEMQVKLRATEAQDNRGRTCEVVMKLPGETLMVSETTMNIFAAVDIVRAKLKSELKKYKTTYPKPRLRKRIAAKFAKS